MEFRLEHEFHAYIDSGNETTAELLESGSSLVAAIQEFYAFFRDDLWAGEIDMSPTQAFLSMNAFMLYMSAIRMALTGHQVATFPLFRTALESACYAYLISQDASLEAVWNDRHKSSEAMKQCRRRFTSAVSIAAEAIENSPHGQKGHAEWIDAAYQSAIDFGAHPNPRSIYRHITRPEDTGSHYVMNLIGLYGADSFETQRSLMACLDYGLVIAVVLAHGLKMVREQVARRLHQLNDLKEALTEEHFPEAFASVGPLHPSIS